MALTTSQPALRLLLPLTLIFQASQDQGTLPEAWTQAIVFPFSKRADAQTLVTTGDNRDISLSYVYVHQIIGTYCLLVYLSTYKDNYVMHRMDFVQIEVVIFS